MRTWDWWAKWENCDTENLSNCGDAFGRTVLLWLFVALTTTNKTRTRAVRRRTFAKNVRYDACARWPLAKQGRLLSTGATNNMCKLGYFFTLLPATFSFLFASCTSPTSIHMVHFTRLQTGRISISLRQIATRDKFICFNLKVHACCLCCMRANFLARNRLSGEPTDRKEASLSLCYFCCRPRRIVYLEQIFPVNFRRFIRAQDDRVSITTTALPTHSTVTGTVSWKHSAIAATWKQIKRETERTRPTWRREVCLWSSKSQNVD